ncbi:uncharacterized protein GLRG_08002, partial [Colletotrichum graminicola M1.001]
HKPKSPLQTISFVFDYINHQNAHRLSAHFSRRLCWHGCRQARLQTRPGPPWARLVLYRFRRRPQLDRRRFRHHSCRACQNEQHRKSRLYFSRDDDCGPLRLGDMSRLCDRLGPKTIYGWSLINMSRSVATLGFDEKGG